MTSPGGGLADRRARLLAATVDELILLGLALPMLYGAIPSQAMLASIAREPELFDPGDLVSAMLTGPGTTITIVAFLIWCGITAWMVAANGQTIGKRMFNIKVVRTDGTPASFARIFLLRNVVNTLPAVLPYVGWLYLFLIDPLLIYQDSHRCAHDLLADTIVVRSKPVQAPGSA